jgi:hypothetical protein
VLVPFALLPDSLPAGTLLGLQGFDKPWMKSP